MAAPFFQFLSVKTFVSFWLVVSLLLGNVILYLAQNDDARHEFFAFLVSFLNRRGDVDFVAHRCETLKVLNPYTNQYHVTITIAMLYIFLIGDKGECT